MLFLMKRVKFSASSMMGLQGECPEKSPTWDIGRGLWPGACLGGNVPFPSATLLLLFTHRSLGLFVSVESVQLLAQSGKAVHGLG